MVTGDPTGSPIWSAGAIGLDAVLAERTPADKVDAVRTKRAKAGGTS